MDTAAGAELLLHYPALAGVLQRSRGPFPFTAMQVPAGAALFSEHEPCRGFPFVLDGEVRVAQRSADGRTMELYRVGPGELCLVSSACLFRAQPMAAHAVTTRPTRLLVAGAAAFREWLADAAFRDFVLGLFAQRMADLTAVIDAVAFHRLDQRLAAALLGHGPELAVTHQQLAARVGTVREMVTRVLRRFERQGWIELARERIRILDVAALRECASGSVTQVTDTEAAHTAQSRLSQQGASP